MSRRSTVGNAYRNVISTGYKAGKAVVAGSALAPYAANHMPTRKKVMTRTKTVSRVITRKKSKVQQGEQSVYSKQNISLGRPERHTLKNVWKKVTANTVLNTFRISQYSQFAGTNGAVTLPCVSPSITTGPMSVPCYMYDLTATPNMVNAAGIFPTIRWTPTFSNPTDVGTVSWTNDLQLQTENQDTSSQSNSSVYAGASEQLNWVQAKMMFYAPLTVPCRFQVDIVQITDTRLVPQTGTVPDGNFHTAFWQSMLKRFIYSPLETGDPKYRKYLKVLHTTSFILNPKESTEATNTVFRELNIFKSFNRTCKYDWQDQDRMAMLSQDAQVNFDNNLSTTVHPRARIFLMIRAQARNGVAFSTNIHPSFDLMLRKRTSQFAM